MAVEADTLLAAEAESGVKSSARAMDSLASAAFSDSFSHKLIGRHRPSALADAN